MLKTVALQKQMTALRSKLAGLKQTRETLRATEKSLKDRLDAMTDATPVEELRSLTAEIDTNTAAQTANDSAIIDTQDEIDSLQSQLDAEPGVPSGEPAPAAAPQARGAAAPAQPAEPSGFVSRSRCFGTRASRDAFYAQDDVKDFLTRVRGLVGQKRAVSGGELTIPTVVLDLIRTNIHNYSKLIAHVRLRSVRGKARQTVVGDVPEAIWTEACGKLNELNFVLTEIEVDGYKVGGYIPICNWLLEDSDVNLGEEIIYMISQAIGLGIDKAIVYGTGTKMPVGIVTRLAAQSQPAWWGTNQGTFTDLHTSNVLQLNLAAATGVSFFGPLGTALGKARPLSGSDTPVWVMNHATHTDIMTRGLAFDSAGTLVSGIGNRMPVNFGEIVELEFIPDNEIVGGYLDAYLLAERDGGQFAQSEHYLFVEDKTVFKGTARYDGQPVRGESFVVVNYNNTAPTTSVSFATDYAGGGMNVLVCTAAAHGSTSGATVVTVAGAKLSPATLKYHKSYGESIEVGDTLGTGWTALTSGSTAITAAAGTPITVVEVDAAGRVISMGTVNSVPKT